MLILDESHQPYSAIHIRGFGKLTDRCYPACFVEKGAEISSTKLTSHLASRKAAN